MKNKTREYINGKHLYYKADFRSGHYELEVIPEIYFYRLTLPSQKIVEGSIPALISRIEHDPRYPDVNAWLLDSLDWKNIQKENPKEKQVVKFTVDGRNYSITFNVNTGEINLHFPKTLIVCRRQDLASPGHFPEIHGIKQGMLSELLASFLAEYNIDDKDMAIPLSLPFHIDTMKYFDIEGWEVGIAYNPETDVIFLDMSARTVYCHLFALPMDAPEFSMLHDRRYEDTVYKILIDAGLHVDTPKL